MPVEPSYVSLGAYRTFSYGGGSDVYMWGDGAGTVTLTMPGGKYTKLVGGRNYNCGLAADDKIYCWGDNTYGQLGNAQSPGGDTATIWELDPTTLSALGVTGFVELATSTSDETNHVVAIAKGTGGAGAGTGVCGTTDTGIVGWCPAISPLCDLGVASSPVEISPSNWEWTCTATGAPVTCHNACTSEGAGGPGPIGVEE
jgi:hypothetical protein